MNFVFQHAFYCHVCHCSWCVISYEPDKLSKKAKFQRSLKKTLQYDLHLILVTARFSCQCTPQIQLLSISKRTRHSLLPSMQTLTLELSRKGTSVTSNVVSSCVMILSIEYYSIALFFN